MMIGIDYSSTLIIWNESIPIADSLRQSFFPHLFVTSKLAQGPLFFFYVKSLTQSDFKYSQQHLKHSISVVIGIIVLIAFNVSMDDVQVRTNDPTHLLLGQIVNVMVLIVPLCYGTAVLFMIKNYYSRLQESYSFFSNDETNWLTILTSAFLVTWSWGLLVLTLGQLVSGELADLFGTFYIYILFVFTNLLFVHSIIHTHGLLSCQPKIKRAQKEEVVENSVLDKISQAISDKQLHLEHNINIEEFANRIDLPVKTVSLAINKQLGTKFFEFINYHRIEEAKKLLATPEHAKLTVLEILLMAGFNNKSSFHRFFNRLVGISPTEYRRQSQKNSDE